MSLSFPNVPNLPGVPQIPRSLNAAVSTLLLSAPSIQNVLFSASQIQNIWGVFDDSGNQVIAPDSIRDFSTRAEWRVSNFPLQRGAFASYNKVTLPAEYAIHMVKGGSVSERQAFQAQVENVAQSLDLFTIVTPEQAYPDCNVSRYEITRKGVGAAFFIEVDMYFQLIVQVAAQYSTTQVNTDTSNALPPSAQPNASQGTVSITQPIATTLQALSTVGIFL